MHIFKNIDRMVKNVDVDTLTRYRERVYHRDNPLEATRETYTTFDISSDKVIVNEVFKPTFKWILEAIQVGKDWQLDSSEANLYLFTQTALNQYKVLVEELNELSNAKESFEAIDGIVDSIWCLSVMQGLIRVIRAKMDFRETMGILAYSTQAQNNAESLINKFNFPNQIRVSHSLIDLLKILELHLSYCLDEMIYHGTNFALANAEAVLNKQDANVNLEDRCEAKVFLEYFRAFIDHRESSYSKVSNSEIKFFVATFYQSVLDSNFSKKVDSEFIYDQNGKITKKKAIELGTYIEFNPEESLRKFIKLNFPKHHFE